MPPKMSYNPLQKFRPCTGMKVNRDFNGACMVYNILCTTSDHACERSITPCSLFSLWLIHPLPDRFTHGLFTTWLVHTRTNKRHQSKVGRMVLLTMCMQYMTYLSRFTMMFLSCFSHFLRKRFGLRLKSDLGLGIG